MKNFLTVTLLLCTVLFALPGGQTVKACDRTEYSLDSIVFTGGLYTIYTTACFGAGQDGFNRGADGDTREFAFAFYTPGGVPITISGFTPASVTGDTTGCTYFGQNFGPLGPPFSSQGTIGYQDFFGCPTGFTCIGNTAACGLIHTQCVQFTFTVDIVPDSIRFLGPEGGGNPVAACYPNPDMVLDFTVLPVVWGDFYGTPQRDGIALNWSTVSETNNDHFEVYRSADANTFERIGTLDGAGTALGQNAYYFLDRNPISGTSHYKIRQVDIDGRYEDTEVISLNFAPPVGMSWLEVGPVPTTAQVDLTFLSDQDQDLSLQVFGIRGEIVIQERVAAKMGSNALNLDLSQFEGGVYYLRLAGKSGKLDYKLMKL